MRQHLKRLYRYTPFFGLAIAIGSVLWAHLLYFPSVGEGSDAAGAGMAQGYALFGFYGCFVLYLMVLIPAFAVFREGDEWPRARVVVSVLLFVPVVLGLAALGVGTFERYERQQREHAAYERFAQTATTTEYRAPDGAFSFRYAASPDGLELVEHEGRVLLFEPSTFSEDHRELVGGIRVRRPSDTSADLAERWSAEYSALTGEPCTAVRASEHPLRQIPSPGYQVFTLPNDMTNDTCLFEYARLLGRPSQGNRELYVVVPDQTPDRAFEVIVDPYTLSITGPVEDNAPGSERVAWYDTIDLDP